jgi:hypothetical protein
LLHLLAHISIFNHCLSITHVCCAVIIQFMQLFGINWYKRLLSLKL